MAACRSSRNSPRLKAATETIEHVRSSSEALKLGSFRRWLRPPGARQKPRNGSPVPELARAIRTLLDRASVGSILSGKSVCKRPRSQQSWPSRQLSAQPALPASATVHGQPVLPVLPVQAPGWLGWFERHAPEPRPRWIGSARERRERQQPLPPLTEGPQSTFLSNAYVAALEQQQSLQEQQHSSCKRNSVMDNGAGVRAIMTPSDHDCRAQVSARTSPRARRDRAFARRAGFLRERRKRSQRHVHPHACADGHV